jgi:hypothetical protein
MPNAIAYAALLATPFVVWVLFWRFSPEKALILSVVGGYLLLPELVQFNLPLLPPWDKMSAPVYAALPVCWAILRREKRFRQMRGMRPRGAPPVPAPPVPGPDESAPAPDPAAAPGALRGPAARPAAGRPGPDPAPRPRAQPQAAAQAVARSGTHPAGTQYGPRAAAAPQDRPLRAPAAGAAVPETAAPRSYQLAPPAGPRRMVLNIAIALHILLPIFIMMTNRDPLPVGGGKVLPAVQLYDLGSMMMLALLGLLPFLLARRFLADPAAHRLMLVVFAVGGLLYSLPILFEVRFSPQLNNWLYGFYPHSFMQHVRDGGFRPMVFLRHGLRIGLFLVMAILAALMLMRISRGARLRWMLAALWMSAVLLVSKNLGAVVILVLLGPALLLTARIQLLAVAAIAATLLFYPGVRGSGLLPLDRILSIATDINPERAGSLRYRLDNEDRLLAKLNERPLFGWGGWARSRVFDPNTGADITVTDGAWIISAGQRGWVGYLVLFGMITGPALFLALMRRRYEIPPATIGVAVLLAANMIDMMPNASLNLITLTLAGAVAGYYERAPLRTRAPVPQRGTDPAAPRDRPAPEPRFAPVGRSRG